MMSIRIQNIPDAKSLRIKAIARVKYGLDVRDYVKMLLAQNESQFDVDEIEKILRLYDAIKNED